MLAEAPKVFVIGGGQLYAQALGRADELVLTEIDADFDGDAFFPEWRGAGFVEVARQAGTPQPGGPAFDVVSWRRPRPAA
jgi:dihydrofolate reductase